MDKIKLKPCPFCGKQAIVNTIEPHTHIFVPLPDYGGETFIECTGCIAQYQGKQKRKQLTLGTSAFPKRRTSREDTDSV